MSQHRWVISPAGSHNTEADTIVVQLLGGEVVVDVPRRPVRLRPREIERLRQALAEARAAALWERGDW